MNGQAVRELGIQLQTHRPAHLITLTGGTPELETTVRYFRDMPPSPPHQDSPFRPSRVGNFRLLGITVGPDSVHIITEGGTIRLPSAMVVYSYDT